MFWFVLRLPAEELLAQDIAAARVQKRLMHTLAQQLELGMAECKIPLLSKPPMFILGKHRARLPGPLGTAQATPIL